MSDRRSHPFFSGTSASELTTAYKNGFTAPSQHLEQVLKLIDLHNEQVNAFSERAKIEDLRAAAAASDNRYKKGRARGPWDGVPVTVKDTGTTSYKGWKTTTGSLFILQSDKIPVDEESVLQVKYLEDQGALILGRTTTPEWCWKGSCVSPAYGLTRNPWDLTLTPGGSSGGGAALVALGAVPLSLGTDGGGSIRIPCSCCGLVGLKPTYGLGSRRPFPYLSHCGPMTRNVEDCALFMEGISSHKFSDWDVTCESRPHNCDFSQTSIKKGIKGLRIAYSEDFGGLIDYVDPLVSEYCRKAVDLLAKYSGATVSYDVSPPFKENGFTPIDDWYDIWRGFCAAKYDALGITEEWDEKMDPGLLRCVKEGKELSGQRMFEVLAQKEQIGECMANFFKDYDLLITPTLPTLPAPARPLEEDFVADGPNGETEFYVGSKHSLPSITCIANMTKQPALSIPCAFHKTATGWAPVGLQIHGRLHSDHILLRAGYVYQQIRDLQESVESQINSKL